MASKLIKCIGFTGQGSQWVGMGKMLLKEYPSTKTILDEVNSILGYSLSDIMFSGPENELKNTVNSQLGIFAYSSMLLDILKNKVGDSFLTTSNFMLGHSVGEFIAMYASNALSFHDCAIILKKRAELVVEACEGLNGGMSAILFCPPEVVQEVISQLDCCEITNINSPSQLVVSGDQKSLEQLPALLKSNKKARRAKVKPLNVNYPFHSSLLQSAANELQQFIKSKIQNNEISVNNPTIPIISNVDFSIMKTRDELIERMGKQLASPVLWKNSIETAHSMGCNQFIEIGPKPVLSALVKSTTKDMDTCCICDIEGINSFYAVCKKIKFDWMNEFLSR